MQADFALDYDVLTVERAQKLYLMARFAAGSSPSQQVRRPLNLSLVLDRSGSMAGAKIDYTRQAVQFLVQHLSANDTCSIVLYNDKVETLFEPQHITNKDWLSQQIDTIRVRGTTNLSGGWLQGCQHVSKLFDDKFLNRVIVLSDGLANRGITDKTQLVALARQKYEEGISTTTMGLGNDFNEDLMMEMANAGGGAFYFIESPEVAPNIFREELSGLLNIVAQNLVITIAPNSFIKSVRQLNSYPIQSNGYGTSFRLGDIFAEETKSLLLELNIPSLNMSGEQQIAVLSFEYDEITETGGTIHRAQDVAVTVNVRAANLLPPPPDIQVTHSVLLLQAANARQEAVKSADRGDFNGASQILRTAALMIDSSVVQNDQLREEQKALMAQADDIAKGEQTYNEYSRKTMSTQAYYTMQSRHEQTVMLRLREVERGNTGNVPSDLAPKNEKVQTSEKPVTTALPNILRTVEEMPAIVPVSARATTVHQGEIPTWIEWRGQKFDLTGDIIRIGRAIHNEIVIEEQGVSRFHSQIRRDGNVLLIEDLGSTNGTLIHGERLKLPYRLSVGDIVYLCDEKLIFK